MIVIIFLILFLPVALYLVGSIFVKLFGFLGMDLPRTRTTVTLTKPLIDSEIEIVRAVLRWLIRIFTFLLGLIERDSNEADHLQCVLILFWGGVFWLR